MKSGAALASWAEDKVSPAIEHALKKLEAMPRTPKGVRVPFPVGDKRDYEDVTSSRERNAAIKAAPVKSVRLDELTAIQRSVRPSRVADYLSDPEYLPQGKTGKWGGPVDLPIVMKFAGTNYIHDAHHRLTAMWLRGLKTAQARVIDVDALKK